MIKKFLVISLISIVFQLFTYAQNISSELNLTTIFKTSTLKPEVISDYYFMNDGENYAMKSHDSLNIYSINTGKLKGTILLFSKLKTENGSRPIQVDNYYFSSNEKMLLIKSETKKIYRRSTKAYYFIYFFDSGRLLPLSAQGKQRLATFSPDATQVAFVRDNNLFIKNLVTGQEIKLTDDGKRNSIINGSTDWVYEEEFGFSKAFFWSPDGTQIAYYKFDEEQVKEFSLTRWGKIYPQNYTYKYPKAGEVNSNISIWVYNIKSQSTIEMKTGTDADIYIPRIKWTHQNNFLSIQKLNRHQNDLKILLADTRTGESKTIYHETNKYYIKITDNLYFLEDNAHFIITNEADGYNHIYQYDMEGNQVNQITSGEWDVAKIAAVDEQKYTLYYIAGKSSPINRELYSVDMDGSHVKSLSSKDGSNDAKFAKKYNYYVNTWSDANSPTVISVHHSNGKLIRSIIENLQLKNTIEKLNFSKKIFFSFTTSENVELNGWMIKPPDFNPQKKYPVLMYVYGGPGSQTVLNKWDRRLSWFQYLAQQGIIIVSVDNRGTGARGEEFKKMTYLQLGKYETRDQIEAARYLSLQSFVDSNRIGIWGWSYGGFMSTSCLALGADVFSIAIAVAPVTDWWYYDNVYTERFMRTPFENPEGYSSSSPINFVNKIKGKFLLIHGSADDNVHFQNSMDLITALVDSNIQFEMQVYPNSNHGIYTGPNTSFHLYTRMTNFIFETLLENKK